jgi:hypothetical protein
VLYAVVLAGLPGTIVSAVTQALRNRYSDNYVFRAAGAPLRTQRTTEYDEKVISDSLRMASDAIFQKSQRPFGFCRNTNRPCAIKNAGKHNCGRNEAQSCELQKPDFLMVLYQEGEGEEKLISRFHYAALFGKLTRSSYGRQERTIDAVVSQLERATPILGSIRKDLTSTKSPLLLPPDNFRKQELYDLLRGGGANGEKAAITQFKRTHFRGVSGSDKKAYVGRSDLEFQPADIDGWHGIADAEELGELAISSIFRLGCRFKRDFHYDVSRLSGTDLAGRVPFYCRRGGIIHPRGRYVNVSVDDVVL